MFNNTKMNQVTTVVGRIFDRKIIIGCVFGVSATFAGYALSAGGLISFGTTTGMSSELISHQSSVVAQSIREDAENCAGGKDGTIGHSIQSALKIHTELASATPKVESLFDVNGECFAGLSQLFDLSFSIPSLQSILSAAEAAVMQYAMKKVCKAVSRVSGMVVSPINKAIDKINGISGFTDLNGMTNGLIEQGMDKIDPELGDEYHSIEPDGSAYTLQTNVFSSNQVNFSGSVGAPSQPQSSTPAPSQTQTPSQNNNNGDKGIIETMGGLFN